MINKSPYIANFIFYFGIVTAALFASISLTYLFNAPIENPANFAIIVFGIIPALMGGALTYMGSYMRQKNRRRQHRKAKHQQSRNNETTAL